MTAKNTRGGFAAHVTPPPIEAVAFAPASVGNVGVGFDILGFALEGFGDRVRARRVTGESATGSATESARESASVRVASISGLSTRISLEPERNTAGRAALEVLRLARAEIALELEIEKGIPLGSGLGGSAASAVAGALAANALLKKSLNPQELLAASLAGEAVASGATHADNVAPSLFGGLQLIYSLHPLAITRVPVPAAVHCVVVHPGFELETRMARAVLNGQVPLEKFVRQTASVAGFIKACMSGDLELLSETLRDDVIEPQRAHLIPGFEEAKIAALKAGALGFSISGAGPSVFAWAPSEASSRRIGQVVKKVFLQRGLEPTVFVSSVAAKGARIVAQKRAARIVAQKRASQRVLKRASQRASR
ncbi:MAG: homoserine kinase [Bdellovibrio sp.]|nr:MAG: homoserine kinase [Bdellovibrio sp.]